MINFARLFALGLILLPASALPEPLINLMGVMLPLTGEVADYGAKVREATEQANHA